MSPPGTAREALLAEALGDLGRLLDRLDAIAPRIDGACRSMNQASERLERQTDEHDRHLASFTERVKVQAVRHIAGRTDELARRSLARQSLALDDAARAIFDRELEAAVARLVKRIGNLQSRPEPPWRSCLTAVGSALLGSALTWMAVLWLWPTP